MELATALTNMTRKLGATFILKGRPLSYSEIFSEVGLLPGLTKRADQLASLCLGYGLGSSYEDAEESLLGIKVIFDEFTPNTLRLFCILDVINEFIKYNGSKEAVPLDELMYD